MATKAFPHSQKDKVVVEELEALLQLAEFHPDKIMELFANATEKDRQRYNQLRALLDFVDM